MKKIIFLFITGIFLTAQNSGAYPDLKVRDISFSTDYPTAGQEIDISADITNTGENYRNPAMEYDPPTLAGFSHVFSGSSTAQSFYFNSDIKISGVNATVCNFGEANALTVSLTRSTATDAGSLPVPEYNPAENNVEAIIASTQTIIHETSVYGEGQTWKEADFKFNAPVTLKKNTTYWMVAENTATAKEDGYGWLGHFHQGDYSGMNSIKITGDIWITTDTYSTFFKISQVTNTTVGFYRVNPDESEVFLGEHPVGPVDQGTFRTTSISTFTPSPGNYKIYALINSTDGANPLDIIETNLENNKRTVALSVLYDKNTKNTVSEGNITVTLEPGSVDDNYILKINPGPRAEAISTANSKLERDGDPFSYPIPDFDAEVTLKDSRGNIYDSQFNKPASITFDYSGSLENNLVDGKVLDQTLKPYILNQDHKLWIRIPDYRINQTKNTVTARVDNFSIFNLIGSGQSSLGDAYAFPVPFKPSEHDKINFTNISSMCTIKIYTLHGDLIETINHVGGGTASWDNINAGSGTYIYTIENENDFKKGKLMIIR